MSTFVRFSAKKKMALEALLSEKDAKSAAAKAGIADRTLRRWMQEDGFQSELRRLTDQRIDFAMRRLSNLTANAIDTLGWAMEKGSKEDSVKVRAAHVVLAHVLRYKELSDLERRIAALENSIGRGGPKWEV